MKKLIISLCLLVLLIGCKSKDKNAEDIIWNDVNYDNEYIFQLENIYSGEIRYYKVERINKLEYINLELKEINE